MTELWLPTALLCGTVVAVAVALGRSGAFMTAEATTIRRVRRRLVSRHARWSGAVAGSSIGRVLQERFAIGRLQLAAGRGDAQAFVRRVATLVMLSVFTLGVTDAVGVLAGAGMVVAPAWIPVAGILAGLLAFAGVQRAARQRREVASLQVAKMLLLFGLLRVPPVHSHDAVQPADPLLALARSMRDPTLAEMLSSEQWRHYAPAPPRSRAELLEAIGAAYGVPILAQLAQLVRSTQEYGGRDPAAEYLATARAFTAQRLADARVRLGSRTITVLVPMVGLLAALFVVIFSAVAYASANGGL